MRFLRSKKGAAIVVALVVAAVASYGAFAYFTSTGAGNGSATVGSSPVAGLTGISINQLPYLPSETEPALVPGGPFDTIDVSVTNNSAGTLYVGTVTAAVDPAFSDATKYPGKPACTAADFTITGSVVFNQDIIAGATVDATQPTGLTIQMKNRSDVATGDGLGNQDNCAGVSVPLVFSSN